MKKFNSAFRNFSEPDSVKMKRKFAKYIVFPKNMGEFFRDKIYTPSTTFWLFLSQMLFDEKSLSNTLIKNEEMFRNLKKTVSQNGASFCKARQKLSLEAIMKIALSIFEKFRKQNAKGALWHGREVKVADGTKICSPDTKSNQIKYPQHPGQKEGCGFPYVKMVVCFSLFTGMIIKWNLGKFTTSELELFRGLMDVFNEGDIFLGDRLYGYYTYLCMLKKKKVGVVVRIKEGLRKNCVLIRKINDNERIVLWEKKNRRRPKWMSIEEWKKLYNSIELREISFQITEKGYRPKKIVLVTTLLDEKLYTATEICELYLKRWNAELYIRDIKTTMKMEKLSCKSPSMIEKEIGMYMIAYNLIRATMFEASEKHNVALDRISFKGAMNRFDKFMSDTLIYDEKELVKRYDKILLMISKHRNPKRKIRFEPRCIKTKHKRYNFLTMRRGKYKETMLSLS